MPRPRAGWVCDTQESAGGQLGTNRCELGPRGLPREMGATGGLELRGRVQCALGVGKQRTGYGLQHLHGVQNTLSRPLQAQHPFLPTGPSGWAHSASRSLCAAGLARLVALVDGPGFSSVSHQGPCPIWLTALPQPPLWLPCFPPSLAPPSTFIHYVKSKSSLVLETLQGPPSVCKVQSELINTLLRLLYGPLRPFGPALPHCCHC